MKSADKLVTMANQIAKNLAVQGEDEAIAGTADHITKFWDPRMRAQMAEHFAAGGEGLSPLAHKAIERLQVPA